MEITTSGPGDPATWGAATFGAHDPRIDDDAGDLEHDLADEIFDDRISRAAWVQDAQGSFTDAEYAAVTSAYLARDPAALFAAMDAAVRREIRDGAKREAERRARKFYSD